MTDREIFLNTAKGYIGTNGNFVCKTNLGLGAVYDWCAFAVSAIMKDCGFLGKYIKSVNGGAGDVPRTSDGKYRAICSSCVTLIIPIRTSISVTMSAS